MTRTSSFPQAKGIVTLTIRDADTMEIKRSQEETNQISMQGFEINVALPLFHFGVANSSADQILITDRITSDGLVGYLFLTARAPTFLVDEDSEISAWAFTEDSPDYAQKTGRFLAPGSNRTINTIHLGNTSDLVFTTASLSTPCVQTTSEILDVTYRIQFFYQTPDPSALPVAYNYGREIARKIVGRGDGGTLGEVGGHPNDVNSYWYSMPAGDGQNWHGLPPTGQHVNANSDILWRSDHGKVEWNVIKTISQDIGKVTKMLGYGSNVTNHVEGMDNTANRIGGNVYGPRSVAWAPFANDDFVNKPIQTIHNHASTATIWGLDVDHLTTGQGSLTVNGDAWTDIGMPEFYRIDHHLSGEVATSRYAFRTRRHPGLNGNGYTPRLDTYLQMWQKKTGGAGDGGPDVLHKTIIDGHGMKDWFRTEEFDDESLITWDYTGVTLCNIINTDAANFDANSTPVLPVTNVHQTAADASGNLWVACASTGLYRISDPWGSPVVTKMTVATNTIVAGGEDNAYGVAIGFNGDIFALVENGLISTSNPTDATPLFSTESFTYTGISDSNWQRVEYMRVDRNSPDNQLCFQHADTDLPLSRLTTVWWSTAATPGIIGPVTSTGMTALHDQHMLVDCSHHGGMWIRSPLTDNSLTSTMNWGTTFLNTIGEQRSGTSRANIFYDYYNHPYLFSGHARNPNVSPGVWSYDEKLYVGMWGFHAANEAQYVGSSVGFQSGRNRNFFQQCASRPFRGSSIDNASTPRLLTWPRSIYESDPLNRQHSPSEEFFWDKYHWNGASWGLGYHADAIDNGGHASGPYPSTRHNFDTEDYTFTGRSMIDVTDVFTASNFASSAVATFAFKLIPEAKLSIASDLTESRQERPRVLLDISDETQQFQILWDSSIQGNIQIVEDGSATTIASTPANSSTYRLIVIVNGTSVDVYLDDAVIGSTVTLNNAYDWDNGDGKLKAYLGSEIYNWPVVQRHSPWPSNFYRGVMENVQFWNSAWDAADVTSDFGDIDGSIAGGTEPAVNQVARFQLTQSLATLETKLSHVSADALLEGITIAFANGGAPTAFIAGDYHTFGVVDGLMKDNATAYSQQYSIYFKPVDLAFSTFHNASATNLIENATTAIVDEVANWYAIDTPPTSNSSNTTIPVVRMNYKPGQLHQGENQGFDGHSGEGAMTMQHISGDGWFEGGPCHGNEGTLFGLDPLVTSSHTDLNIAFGIELITDGSVDIVEAGVTTQVGIATYVVGDVFRVRRIGTAITYYKNGVLIHTSGNTTSATLYGRVSMFARSYGLRDCKITYTRPVYVMSVGSVAGNTGAFDPEWWRMETRTPESIDISIGGSPATVTVSNLPFVSMISPGPGEVVVNGVTGWLSFNAADVGSAVTGDVTVIYNSF